jgi:hypothetical protein
MSATIHYLRPFEREDLAKTTGEDGPDDGQDEADEPGAKPKRRRRRAMPCGRNSRFKKRMDGTVVVRKR